MNTTLGSRACGWLTTLVATVAVVGQAATITVGPGGPPTYDYDVIQDAIDAAASNDTIIVAAGLYEEDLAFNVTGLTVVGPNVGISAGVGAMPRNDEAIIVGQAQLLADYITLDGLQFNRPADSGLKTLIDARAQHPTIRNCRFDMKKDLGSCTAFKPNTTPDIAVLANNIFTNQTQGGEYTQRVIQGGSSSQPLKVVSNVFVDVSSSGAIYNMGHGSLIQENRFIDAYLCTLFATHDVTLVRNDFVSGLAGIYFGWGAANTTIIENNFHPSVSWGVYAAGASGTVMRRNNMLTWTANTSADPADAIDATRNWWGSTTGPTHASNPDGTGSGIQDNVVYSPWLGRGDDKEPAAIGYRPWVRPLVRLPDDEDPWWKNTELKSIVNFVDTSVGNGPHYWAMDDSQEFFFATQGYTGSDQGMLLLLDELREAEGVDTVTIVDAAEGQDIAPFTYGLRGGAISDDLGIILSASILEHYDLSDGSPSMPVTGNWNYQDAGPTNVYVISHDAGERFSGWDSASFSHDSRYLYSVHWRDAGTNEIWKWEAGDLQQDGTGLTSNAVYFSQVHSVWSVSAYPIGDRDLLYYGGVDKVNERIKIMVFDTVDEQEIVLIDLPNDANHNPRIGTGLNEFEIIQNVKVSGIGHGQMYLYVSYDFGLIEVYRLNADGKSVAELEASLTRSDIARAMGKPDWGTDNWDTGSFYRCFEVTNDGRFAILGAHGGDRLRVHVLGKGPPPPQRGWLMRVRLAPSP